MLVAEDDGTADDEDDNDDVAGSGGEGGDDDLWLCDAVKPSCISRSGVAATDPLLSLVGIDDDKADENAADDNADDCIELRNWCGDARPANDFTNAWQSHTSTQLNSTHV